MDKLARKEREFKARRTEIMEQAEKIFSARGFHDVTMAEIANASGFSIGSLYQFFTGKENLYTTMISEKMDLMYGQIREEVRGTEEIADKISMLIGAHFQFVENNADLCRLLLRGENASVSEIMASLQKKMMDDYLHHLTFIEDLLDAGTKTGFLRPLPPQAMARALFGLIRSTSIDWMFLPTDSSLSSKKDFVLDIFLKGVQQNEG
jgi:AcrR family transcriptional regulator